MCTVVDACFAQRRRSARTGLTGAEGERLQGGGTNSHFDYSFCASTAARKLPKTAEQTKPQDRGISIQPTNKAKGQEKQKCC
jgi:hypothetical protein